MNNNNLTPVYACDTCKHYINNKCVNGFYAPRVYCFHYLEDTDKLNKE